MQPACGDVRSSDPISDQELQRAIKPNMGQARHAVTPTSSWGDAGAKSESRPLRRRRGGEAAEARHHGGTARLHRPADRPETGPPRPAVEGRRRRDSPAAGTPMMRATVPAAPHLRFAGRPHCRKRHHVDRGPGQRGARRRAVDHAPQDRFQAVVIGVMQVIRFGRSKQNAVDARPDDLGSTSVRRPVRKQSRIAGERALEVATASGPALKRCQGHRPAPPDGRAAQSGR